MSGGVLWLPNSSLVAGAGGSDSADEGKRYMKSVIDEPHLEKRIDAYVEQIPGFIDFLHRKHHLRLAPLPQFPDMYPDNPDAKMHRCHEAVPFHARALPADEVLKLRPQHPQTALFGLIGWTPSESLILQARGEGWLKVASAWWRATCSTFRGACARAAIAAWCWAARWSARCATRCWTAASRCG